MKRSKSLSECKLIDQTAAINKLEAEKEKIEYLIYGIEKDNKLSDLHSELECIKDQERMNGMRNGKTRLYFRKGTQEYERKAYLKKEIEKI